MNNNKVKDKYEKQLLISEINMFTLGIFSGIFSLLWYVFGGLSGSEVKYYVILTISLAYLSFSILFLVISLVKNNSRKKCH